MVLRRSKTFFVFALIIAFMLCSCASFVDNAYKVGFTANTLYDAGMKSVSKLQADGKITTEQRAEINKYANMYYASAQGFVVALSTYNKMKDKTSQEALILAMSAMTTNYLKLYEIVNAFAPNTFGKLEVD